METDSGTSGPRCAGPGRLRLRVGGRLPEGNGGTLDVDQCISPCGTQPHAENIVFDDTALSGEYEVWVVNFGGRAAGDFSIEVAGDVSAAFQGSLPAGTAESFEFPESMRYAFTL